MKRFFVNPAHFVSQTVMASGTSSSTDKTAADGPSQQSSSPTICLEWSIRPLVIWIRILGVDLPADISNSIYSCCRCGFILLRIYGVICLLFRAIGEIEKCLFFLYCKKTTFERVGGVNYEWTTTATWNVIIDFTNYAVRSLGIHVMLVTVIRTRWIHFLMEISQRSTFVFTDENYVRLRRISFLGVVYVILLASAVISFPYFPMCFVSLSDDPRRHPTFTPCINPDLSICSLSLRFLLNSRKWTQISRCWRLKDGSYNFHEDTSITLLFLHVHHYILMVSTRFHCDLFVQTRLHDFDGWHFASTRKRRYNDSAIEKTTLERHHRLYHISIDTSIKLKSWL